MRTGKSRKSLTWALMFTLLLSTMVVWAGCDNGDDETLGVHALIQKYRPELVESVGIDVCTFCHALQTEQWLQGQHGNAMDGSTLDIDGAGFPDYGYFYDGDTVLETAGGVACAECHDPQGDGQYLTPDLTGNQPRPVIGCESCHGGGAEHFGAGQIPYPSPDAERCGQCHNSDFDHEPYHPNGDDIYEEYVDSPHSRSINSHNLDEDTGEMRARCSRCHTDEGYRKYIVAVPGTSIKTKTQDDFGDYFANIPNIPADEVSNVTCRTCHDPHQATGEDLERLDESMIGGNLQSRQFNTCTGCHQLIEDDGAQIWEGNTAADYHTGRHSIIDTHAAGAADTRYNMQDGDTGTDLEKPLVFVKQGDDHACAGCHNPHSADVTANEEWAESGHGDLLGDPWVHYDWKAGGSRAACQRCHTSTGFMNFANSLITDTAYVTANNDFSHLGAGQAETLYCWACHAAVRDVHGNKVISNTDKFKDNFRDPGAFPLQYNAMSGNTAFPDLGGSNVCIACHSGRESGSNVEALANTVFDGDTLTPVNVRNSHYLPAGGIIFREIGYEYYVHEGTSGDTVNPNYSDPSYFAHGKIGTPAAGSTVNAIAGENGPCAGCHMHGSPEKHHFSPFAQDGSTVELASVTCSACHNGTHELTVEEIEENEEHFHSSLAFLRQLLVDLGLSLTEGHPYISGTEATWSKDSNGTPTYNGDTGRANMGAAFNYNMLHHEPGAFAHNRYYTKRLIYDSIDWLDNNAMDQSVAGTLTTLAGAHTGVLDGQTLLDAQAFLIKNSGGKTRP